MKSSLPSIFTKFKEALTSPMAAAISNFANLALALTAIAISIIAIRNANEQFIENNYSADSLFRFQLKHAEEINNRLIKHIEEIQKINEIQLSTAQLNLSSSQQFHIDQNLTGKPVLEYDSIVIANEHDLYGLYSPQIILKIKNTGVRPAHNLKFSSFIVDSSKSIILSSSNTTLSKIGSMFSSPYSCKPHFNYKYRSGFYLFLRVAFEDQLASKLKDSLCTYQYKDREMNAWIDCKESDLKAISKLLRTAKFDPNLAR